MYRLLDRIDHKVDTTQNRLHAAQQRLNRFIKDNAGAFVRFYIALFVFVSGRILMYRCVADSKSQWCIIGLTIVVVILIILVVVW